MERYLPLLQTTTLFAGLSRDELSALLAGLGAAARCYGRGEVLIQSGTPSRNVGVLLAGQLQAVRPAPDGSAVWSGETRKNCLTMTIEQPVLWNAMGKMWR